MTRLIAVLTVTAAVTAAPLFPAADRLHAQACDTKWTGSQYKSYRQVESEVRGQLGDVKILRVMLCGEGAGAYFQVVVMKSGTVQNVRIAAR
jgi:hypothetical protein